jgi:hypothetical protein
LAAGNCGSPAEERNSKVIMTLYLFCLVTKGIFLLLVYGLRKLFQRGEIEMPSEKTLSAKKERSLKMNYILIALSVALTIALFYVKYLVSENTILKENEKVIIEAYENSIEQIEKKAKFEKEVIIQKEPVVKASERVKVETKKRGEINENNTNSDFVIVSF